MAYDHATRQRFLELRGQGCSYTRIARELNVGRRTLVRWGLEMQSEIGLMTSLHYEAVQEEVEALAGQRIAALGRHLQTLIKEAAGRNLASIHTTNLFQLILRYATALRKEDGALHRGYDFNIFDPNPEFVAPPPPEETVDNWHRSPFTNEPLPERPVWEGPFATREQFQINTKLAAAANFNNYDPHTPPKPVQSEPTTPDPDNSTPRKSA